mmetsp:Transcript_12536/g.21212  ORF Transcript_12536/g.21212 Transcript_12536/m.21212 type:complete len:117 (-) Transcript_12536:796-1146(-)
MERWSCWHFNRCTLPPTSTKMGLLALHPLHTTSYIDKGEMESSQTEKFVSSCDTTTHSPQQHYLFYGSFFFSKLVLASVLAGTNGYKSDHTVGLARTEGRESAVLAIDAEIPRRCV